MPRRRKTPKKSVPGWDAPAQELVPCLGRLTLRNLHSGLSTSKQSSSSNPLETLPDEILVSIVVHLEPQDLRKARFTSKRLNKIAVQILFSSMTLRTSPRSFGRLDAVLSREHLIAFVKEIRFCHYVDPELLCEPQHLGQLNKHAIRSNKTLSKLNRVQYLKAVSVEFFRWTCHDTIGRVYRCARLKEMFNALHEHHVRLEKLTIKHLPIVPDDELTLTEAFRCIISNLRELHIRLVGPDRGDHQFIFPLSFETRWLGPVSGSLVSLSLRKGFPWGVLPVCFDFAGINFPCLESLVLGYYSIGHDDQMDWVLASKTLRKLHLRDCSIMRTLVIDPNLLKKWRSATHDWLEARDGVAGKIYYPGRWETWFRRFNDELVLDEFEFSFTDHKDYPANFDELPSRRYTDYDADDESIYRVVSEGCVGWKGEIYEPGSDWHEVFRPVFTVKLNRGTLEKDSDALDELMASIEGRGAHGFRRMRAPAIDGRVIGEVIRQRVKHTVNAFGTEFGTVVVKTIGEGGALRTDGQALGFVAGPEMWHDGGLSGR